MKLNFLHRFLICCLFFLGGGAFVQGQTITNVQVVDACVSSPLDFSFYLTDGNQGKGKFYEGTTFTVHIGTDFSNSMVLGSLENLQIDAKWGQTINATLQLPPEVGPGYYHIGIVSSDPDSFGYSGLFRVGVETPIVKPEVQISCIGGNIQLTASAITDATYEWSGPNGFSSNQQNPVLRNVTDAMAGNYTVVASIDGCFSEPATTVVKPLGVPATDESMAGTNGWIGHIYDGEFEKYIGSYSEIIVFDQDFGGSNTCFDMTSGGSVFTEDFSVRYRMNVSLEGLFVMDLGSDDGSRLTVNGELVYDNWSDQAFSINPRVLFSLSGSNELVYEFYENSGGNRISIVNPVLVIGNSLDGNIDQEVCMDGTAAAISGDVFIDPLPAGITGKYSWTYSLTPTGERFPIPGQNSASFTPNPALTDSPFKEPNTYYIYRNASLTSINNTGVGTYTASHESNAAILKVIGPQIQLSAEPISICKGGATNLSVNLSGLGPWQVSGSLNGQNFSYRLTEDLVQPLTLYENSEIIITSVTDIGTGCTNEEDVSITIEVLDEVEWTGMANTDDWDDPTNWSCGYVPEITTDVTIPAGPSIFPVIYAGITGFANNILIESGASVEVQGDLKLAGAISNQGIFDARKGEIWMQGTSAQVIPANAFVENKIEDLVINNSSDVGLGGALLITGSVLARNGDLKTNTFLTLISDASQTALIDGSGTGEIIGTVTMQRYLDPAFGYKYISSPFSGTTVGDFAGFVDLTAAFPNFYAYNEDRNFGGEDASGWENYTGLGNTLNVMQGYAANFGGDSQAVKTISISGEVNNGSLEIQLTNHGGMYTKGFNLVGNPYPSPIDWKASAGWTKVNIDDAIYFFTASDTSQYTGTYTSYVGGISSDGRASNIIPSMQGFFVHVSDPGLPGTYPITATLGMTNEVRVTNFNQAFYKSAQDRVPLLRISAAFGKKAKGDPAVVYFDRGASLSFDKEFDALKMMNTDVHVPNLYSISEDQKELSINAVPLSGSDDLLRIPLGIKVNKSGRISLQLEEMQNHFSGYIPYLVDLERRVTQNLEWDDSYNFYLDKGTYENRLELLLSRSPITDIAVALEELFSVSTGSGTVQVNLNLDDFQQAEVRLSNLSGQILRAKMGRGKETIRFKGIRNSGVYIVVVDLGGSKHSKKVLVKL